MAEILPPDKCPFRKKGELCYRLYSEVRPPRSQLQAEGQRYQEGNRRTRLAVEICSTQNGDKCVMPMLDE